MCHSSWLHCTPSKPFSGKDDPMLEFLINDGVNDISLIRTTQGIYVRYGLEKIQVETIAEGLERFNHCLRHALQSKGECL